MGDKLLEEGTYFIRHDVIEPVTTVDNNIIQSCFRIMDCYLADYIETEIKKVAQEKIDDLLSIIGPLFIFAFIWSHGCTTNLEGRLKFDAFCRKLLPEMGVSIPTEGLVYDYKYDGAKKEWLKWFETVPAYEVDIKASFEQIVVPTNDSIRMKYICRLLLSNGKHVLCPGPTGTGKSVNTTELISNEMAEEFLPLTMTFSAQTSANQTQDYLDEKFDKRRKGVYGPPVGKKYTVFVDDLNMPKKEEYGAQPPLELLRQYLDHKGWYDRKSKEKPFTRIEDMFFISAMGPPGGGRAAITARLQRHFNIITYTDLQLELIDTIFNTIVTAFYRSFSVDVKDSVDPLIKMTLRVYNAVLTGPLKPTPNKSHYLFNLRDVSRISQGLCLADRRSVVETVHVIRLWLHENMRVFGDRLIDNIDRNWLKDYCLDEA